LAGSLSMARSLPDRVDRVLRGLGGLAALAALVAALVGIARGRRGPRVESAGGPGVGEPAALAAATAGFLGASAILWRPLPIAAGVRPRALAAATGAAAMLGGLGLYLAGMAALGPAYDVSSTSGARVHEGQRLVTSGPYAVVRHPMYLGLAIAAVGGLLLYRTWTSLVYVAALPVVVVRARREDEVLAGAFGPAWATYRDGVPAWIPRPTRFRRPEPGWRCDPRYAGGPLAPRR